MSGNVYGTVIDTDLAIFSLFSWSQIKTMFSGILLHSQKSVREEYWEILLVHQETGRWGSKLGDSWWNRDT